MSENTSKPKSAYVDDVEYDERLDSLPGEDTLDSAVSNLESRGFDVQVVADRDAALEAVKSAIPAGASIMNGHSTTLEEIGFVDYLIEADHDWENYHDKIFATEDEAEAQRLRRESQTAEYFLGSVNAIAETGELLAADASGSRVGAYPFAAENLLLVSGTNKLVPDLETARERLNEVAYGLENERAQDEYGMESAVSKAVTFHRELEDGRTTLVLVQEQLGF